MVIKIHKLDGSVDRLKAEAITIENEELVEVKKVELFYEDEENTDN